MNLFLLGVEDENILVRGLIEFMKIELINFNDLIV